MLRAHKSQVTVSVTSLKLSHKPRARSQATNLVTSHESHKLKPGGRVVGSPFATSLVLLAFFRGVCRWYVTIDLMATICRNLSNLCLVGFLPRVCRWFATIGERPAANLETVWELRDPRCVVRIRSYPLISDMGQASVAHQAATRLAARAAGGTRFRRGSGSQGSGGKGEGSQQSSGMRTGSGHYRSVAEGVREGRGGSGHSGSPGVGPRKGEGGRGGMLRLHHEGSVSLDTGGGTSNSGGGLGPGGAGRVWLIDDVTAEHDARLAVEEADKAKAKFLAMMSYELRTPLTGRPTHS